VWSRCSRNSALVRPSETETTMDEVVRCVWSRELKRRLWDTASTQYGRCIQGCGCVAARRSAREQRSIVSRASLKPKPLHAQVRAAEVELGVVQHEPHAMLAALAELLVMHAPSAAANQLVELQAFANKVCPPTPIG
jgi:hypothetical protein